MLYLVLMHFIVDFARAACLWEQIFYFIFLFSIDASHCGGRYFKYFITDFAREQQPKQMSWVLVGSIFYHWPHELQICPNSQSPRPRKKYKSFLPKNVKIPPPHFFSAHAYFWCFNLQQHSFNLHQLVLKICSNYFKYAADLFNLLQLYFICSNVF